MDTERAFQAFCSNRGVMGVARMLAWTAIAALSDRLELEIEFSDILSATLGSVECMRVRVSMVSAP